MLARELFVSLQLSSPRLIRLCCFTGCVLVGFAVWVNNQITNPSNCYEGCFVEPAAVGYVSLFLQRVFVKAACPCRFEMTSAK